MKANIIITLKNGVLDPQGDAVKKSLHSLGFQNVEKVRIGKYIEVKLLEENKEKGKQQLEQIYSSLLANTVVENYQIELE